MLLRDAGAARAMDDVLLSPDLLPHVFASLGLADCRAAAAHSAWAAAWAALLRRRRYVHARGERVLWHGLRAQSVAVLPDGCVCFGGFRARLVLRPQQSPDDGAPPPSPPPPDLEVTGPSFTLVLGLLPTAHSLYVSDYAGRVHRLRLSDGAALAASPELGLLPHGLALAGERLLVATESTVTALDAATLERRGAFGAFGEAVAVAAHGGEVFVADVTTAGELHVYSAAGQRRRTLRGPFGFPAALAVRDGRVYLLEAPPPPERASALSEEARAWAARRLVVLTLDGALHQRVRLPRAPAATWVDLALRGDELFLLSDLSAQTLMVMRILSS